MLKVGVIGAGKWGTNHLRVYSELDCRLVGIADVDASKSELAKRFNIKFFADYKQLLKEVDAVSIVVPTNLHYEVASCCLEQGKHVLIEKPMTLDYKESLKLLELAKRKNLVLHIGYLFRFNAAVRKLKELVKSAGELQYITGRYIHSNKPPRRDCGVVFNFGIHLIDILSYVIDKKPLSVYCKKGNLLSKEREDYAFMILNYKNFSASLEASWLHPEKKRDFWIIGSRAKIYADLFEQIVKIYPIEITNDWIKREPEANVEINKNEPLKEEIKHFCECIIKGDCKEDAEGVFSVRLCELCLESAEKNKEVNVG